MPTAARRRAAGAPGAPPAPTGTTAYHSSAYSTTAYHTSTTGTTAYYGGTYAAYHPPTTVNYYGSWCYNCGGWSTAGAAAAGAAVGMAAGAAVASANTAAATSSAYSAGYALARPTRVCHGRDLCDAAGRLRHLHRPGTTYYQCGTTWFQPSYGANGVYYRVVPTP